MSPRIPPHDLEAEESLLGAMLLSRDALVAGADLVSSADFYAPKHGYIFQAIVALSSGPGAVDPVTVAAFLEAAKLLEQIGGRPELLRIQAGTPASANVRSYAGIVSDRARLRRAIELGGALAEAGYEQSGEKIDDLLASGARSLAPPREQVRALELDELVELADRDDEDPAKPWVIPALFRLMETLILTGGEGWGKATLLRQIGVCCASGIHPFTGLCEGGPDPMSVLYLDLQEDEIDVAQELRRLRHKAGDAYVRGNFHAISRPAGINLLTPAGFRLLDGLLDDYRPALLLVGPLVRMFRGTERSSRYSEDLVDDLTDRLDDLRVRYRCSIMLEAHVGNDRSDDAESWRVRGSSVFRSWPFFGFGMKPVRLDPVREVEMKVWRGARHAGRPWPKRLYGGRGWPWVPDDPSYEKLCRTLGLHWLIDGAVQDPLGDEPF